MYAAAENSSIGALEIAERLIESGLNFREAYKVTAEVVKIAVDGGKTLKGLTKDDVIAKVKELTGRDVDVSSSIIEKATDPKEALDAKRSPGSAHPGEMGRMVEERKEVLDRHVKDLDFLKFKITISKDNLKNALKQYRL
jgi:argininosuccinate lyase